MDIIVSSVHVYPLKSGRELYNGKAKRIYVSPDGTEYDRRFMLVEDHPEKPGAYNMVTQRTVGMAGLARVDTDIRGNDLISFRAYPTDDMIAGFFNYEVAATPVTAYVHGQPIQAFDAGDEAAKGFSEYFGRPLRLLMLRDGDGRPLTDDFTGPNHKTGFSDGAQLLVTTIPSLHQLQNWIDTLPSIPMSHFRPNIVLDGNFDAFAEDGWAEIEFDGGVRLLLPKPCSRCVIPEIDQATGIKRDDKQPTTALHQFRRVGRDRFFGENATVIKGGTIKVGEKATVVAFRKEPHPLIQGIKYTGLHAA